MDCCCLACCKKGTELFIYTLISIKAFPPVAACLCRGVCHLAASHGLSWSGGCLPATRMGICAQQSSRSARRGCRLEQTVPISPGSIRLLRPLLPVPCAACFQSSSVAGVNVADPSQGREL